MKLLNVLVPILLIFVLAGCGGGSSDSPAPPPRTGQTDPVISVPFTKLSTDTFANAESQHATEVEPSAASNGSTIISAFQVGRISSGGAADIGFATSTNGGATWTQGFLPGITTNYQGGTYQAVSDPSVAYDAAHMVWMIASLALNSKGTVIVSRSLDGISWVAPVVVSATNDADKNWIACDNTASSPYYGNCYTIWDDPSAPNSGRVFISASNDGGNTWQPAQSPADLSPGIGGIPVVQPNGTVIVPMLSNSPNPQSPEAILSFRSTDGGVTWSATTTVSSATTHTVAGGMRTDSLPSVDTDSAGKVYVIWHDCRFRASCSSNDLVMSTSADGLSWTQPVRIPIDASTSSADYFIPALAIEPGTGGATARLALTYYYFPNASCTNTDCSLNVGFISSQDGGKIWSSPTTLVSGMYVTSLATTTQGYMVGDYIATTFSNGQAFPFVAIAKLPSGTTLDEAIYTTTSGLTTATAAQSSVDVSERVLTTESDHAQRRSVDLEGRYPKTLR